MSSPTWHLEPRYGATSAARLFRSLEAVFELDGETVTRGSFNDVVRIRCGGATYYVKRYVRAGNSLRTFVRSSRARTEWENLAYFDQLGIPTAPLVAYGEDNGRGHRGALVTEAVPTAIDLSRAVTQRPTLFADRSWRWQVLQQVADFARRLHDRGFVHGDLRWRNILVTTEGTPRVHFIDCPAGWLAPRVVFGRGVAKDLASLDKPARRHLSRSDRLRFFRRYRRVQRIAPPERALLRKITELSEDRA